MTAHVNAVERPTLPPLWTGYEGFRHFPTTTFRTAHGPLLSPSPVSPRGLPSPRRPSTSEGYARKNSRALAANHAIIPSTVSSPSSYVSMEGQSPLVSKLEEVSLRLADAGTTDSSMPSPATERSVGAIRARHSLRPREDYGNISTADAFIIARSIRQPNGPAADISRPFWKSESAKSKPSHRLTLRAVIRPKAPGRQTFLIQRSLDIDELRAIASTRRPSYKYDRGTWPSKAGRRPLPVPAKWSSNDRRLSTGLSSPETERFSRRTSHATGYDKLIRDSKTVPIRTWSSILVLFMPLTVRLCEFMADLSSHIFQLPPCPPQTTI